MPAMESQSDERDHLGAVEHAANILTVTIGNLCAGDHPTESRGGERRHRVESRYPRQAAGTTARMYYAGLSTDVT